MKRATRALPFLLVIALAASACGGGDEAEKDSTDGAESGDAISSLEDAKSATVQVIAEGEFRDPEVGTVSGAGSGSGLIVDPDGIVVTNNHVVTGAGAITVRVGGEDDEIPAEVLGVSECNDLAVLQLDDPGPYPYFEWSDEAPEPPLDVYALGFPLGDPEYTVTKGVVSKAEADGESSWASVRNVIEHDANIQPGNSGGPLVDEDGVVVGVNYAESPGAGDTSQFFAISEELARDVVETLREGDDDSLGVNGTAILDEEAGIAGVWVNGVDAGGPASETGIEPGDIITNLNGVQLDSGTMKEYCDVLRSSGDEEPLSVRVLRFDTSEELEGEIFGDELETTYSFATQVGGEVEQGDDSGAIPVDDYVDVADDTGRITTIVPDSWSDLSTSPQDLAGTGTPQPTLLAAPSLSDFNSNAGPGVGVIVIDGFGASGASVDEVLTGAVEGSGCTEAGREQYDDGLLVGPYAVTDCGGVTGIILTAGLTTNPDVLVLVLGLATTDNDLAVIDEVLANLIVS